jgi:hypothetical protein
MARTCRSSALLLLLLSLLLALPSAPAARAQEGTGIPLGGAREPIVHRKDILCAGFISKRKLATDFKIIGGEREDEINWYTTTNIVYLDYGAKDGASAGESLYVIRPQGKFENPFTGKDLGYYHEEVGVIRIIAVQRRVSTAEVVMSCDGMLVGDIVRPFDQYVAPEPRAYEPLNRYELPNGQLSGQIVLSRGYRDYLSQRDIAFIDIGADQGVKVGQYFTIYRKPGHEEGPVGPENVFNDDPLVRKRDSGFSDKRYHGGEFSIIAPYEYDAHVRDKRKGVPRKVLGELCVIRVEGHTATAVITRTQFEVNLGDYVELDE